MPHARADEAQPGGRDLGLDVAVVPGFDTWALDDSIAGRAAIEAAGNSLVVGLVELREARRPQGVGGDHVEGAQCGSLCHQIGHPFPPARERIGDEECPHGALHLPGLRVIRAGITVEVVVGAESPLRLKPVVMPCCWSSVSTATSTLPSL